MNRTNDELVQEQMGREAGASLAVQAKRLREIAAAADAGSIERIPAAKIVISRLFADMLEAVQAQVAKTGRGPGAAKRGWIREIPNDVLTVITIRTCLSLCLESHAKGPTLQRLAVGIGRQVVQEILVRAAEKANPLYMQAVHGRFTEGNVVNSTHIQESLKRAAKHVLGAEAVHECTEVDLLHMGKHCVHAALVTGLIDMHRGRTSKGPSIHFVLPDELRDTLLHYHPNLFKPAQLPSVAPPRAWDQTLSGGYYTAEMTRPLLRLPRTAGPATKAAVFDNLRSNPRIMHVLNYLQGVGFTLDEGACSTLQQAWAIGSGVLGLPSLSPPPRPPFPLSQPWDKESAPEEEVATYQNWSHRMITWYTEDKRRIARVAETASAVRCTRELAGRPVWFPMHMDFRSRLYYCGSPNPQGADPARSTVFFNEKKPLGERGLFWLKVHIANSLGYDKTRFKDRAAWVDTHWEALSEGAQAPWDAPLYRDSTDAPFVACSAVQELSRAYASGDPLTYCTGIPIHMDATCSGLQHFSAMVRDQTGAQYTNLVDSGGPEKADIYRRVAELAMQQAMEDAMNPEHKSQVAAQVWLELGIPRSLAKKPVMTYVYGATLQSVTDHCRLHLEELEYTHPLVGNRSLGRYMARTLFSAVERAVPAAAEVMHWLRKRCREHGRDHPMLWKNPMGFLVSLDIPEQIIQKVRVRSCGIEQVVMRRTGEKSNGRRVGNSIAPNFVHSLDAAHLCITAERMQAAGLRMIGIHDSFGTHACDVDAMHRIVREAFVQLYSECNPLEDFLAGLERSAELPPTGTFDITKVLESEFFFS